MRVLEFAFTGYPVTDLARARKFYEEVLGLKASDVWEEGPGKAWVEYQVGPHTLAISNMEPDWAPCDDGPSVAFEVENFETSIAELKAAGVKFYKEPFETPVCRIAVIADPDTNAITIHKRKS